MRSLTADAEGYLILVTLRLVIPSDQVDDWDNTISTLYGVVF